MRKRFRTNSTFWIPLVLLVANGIVFGRVLQHQFVPWDDDINIYRNIHHGPLTWTRLVWMFTDTQYVLYYAPLSWMTLAMICSFAGLNPLGYHLANVLLHSTNAVLVFFLIRRICRNADLEGGVYRGILSDLAAGWGALFWAIHPLRVEAVAWATGISYLLAAFFCLISMLAYIQAPEGRAYSGRYWQSLAAFAASLMAYPVAMAYPVILVVLETLVFKRRSDIRSVPAMRRIIERVLPFGLLSAAALGFTLYRRANAAWIWSPPVTLAEFGLMARIMQAFYIWTYYLWKPFDPVRLAPVYTDLFDFDPWELRFQVSLLAVCAITGFLIWKRERLRGLLALWICYLAFLVPVLGITEHPHYPSDRYSYFVGVLLSIAGSLGIIYLWRIRFARVLMVGLSITVVCLLGVMAHGQTRIWRNGYTLFTYVLQKLGEQRYSCDIQWRLGLLFASDREWHSAEEHYRKAIRICPHYYQAELSLAGTLTEMGRFEEALPAYDAALVTNPRSIESYVAKGRLYLKLGNKVQAVEAFAAALKIEPNSPEACYQLAWIRATDPNAEYRNGSEAVVLALRACQATLFDDPRYLKTLAASYAEVGNFQEAIQVANDARNMSISRRIPQAVAELDRQLGRYRISQPFRDHSDDSGDTTR